MNNYIKGKGILVGVFNEDDLNSGADKNAVKKATTETGYKYTNIEFIKEKEKIVGIKVYVCSAEDFSF